MKDWVIAFIYAIALVCISVSVAYMIVYILW